MSFPTGRTRTLVASGTIEGNSNLSAVFGTVDPFGLAPLEGIAQSSGYCEAYFCGDGFIRADWQSYTSEQLLSEVTPDDWTLWAQISWNLFVTTPNGAEVVGPVNYGGFVDEAGAQVDWTGEWEITCDTEERFEIYALDPDETDTIDQQEFPNWGPGGAHGDGLPGIGVRYFEIPRVGGSCSASVSLNGESLTRSSTIAAADFAIDHLLTLQAVSKNGSYDSAIPFQESFITGEVLGDTAERAGVSYSNGGGLASYDGGCRSYVPPIGTGQFDLAQNTAAQLYWKPLLRYSLDFRARSFGGPFPSPLTVFWATGGVSSSHTANPSVTFTRDLRHEVTIATVLGASFGPGGVTQHGRSRLWLTDLADAGQDTRDWRVQQQLYPYHALTLSQALSHSVASNQTLNEADPNLDLSTTNWEGYRYLELTLAPSWPGSRSLTLTHGPKTYSVAVPNGGGTVLVDLCAPNNLPGGFEIDRRDVRYPLDNQATGVYTPIGGIPKDDQADDRDKGWLWGSLKRPATLGFSGLGAGETLGVSNARLRRERDSFVSVNLPFLRAYEGWESPTDNTFLDPDISLLSDGREVGPWPCRARVVPKSGPVGPSLTYYSISSVAGFLAHAPGWACVVETPPTLFNGDPWPIGSGSYAGFLDGYVWTGSAWRSQVDLSVGSASLQLWAVLKADEVRAYPGCGNPLGSYGGAFPVRASKILRGRAQGLVFTESGDPFEAADIVTYRTADPAVLAGSTISGLGGVYATGTPYGRGNVQHSTELRQGEEPYLSDAATWANRWPERTSFVKGAESAGSLDYDVAWDHRHARAYDRAGALYLGFTGNGKPFSWTDVDTGLTDVDHCSIRWRDSSLSSPLLVQYLSAGTLTLAETLDQGQTLNDLMTIASGVATADFEARASRGSIHYYVLTGENTVRAKVYDASLTERDSFATNVTDCDPSKPIRVKESPVDGGGWRMGIQYTTVGGSLVFKTSDVRGKDFS